MRRSAPRLAIPLLVVVVLAALPAAAFEVVPLGPVAAPGAGDPPVASAHGAVRSDVAPCLTAARRAAIATELAASRRDLTARGLLPAPDKARQVSLGWPLRAADHVADPGVHGVSGYVDHDPDYPGVLLDWNCGGRSYDTPDGYNHQGTDYFLWPFSWHLMDDEAVAIVAAAPGVIIAKADGHVDRNCGFGGDPWNAVYVEHADGSVAWYGHMKSGSTTDEPVGAAVAQGEYLGLVGSSGNSTGPHLHLELYDAEGRLRDPYDGPCNDLPDGSWWADQRPYDDSHLNALRTHSAPPAWQDCPTPTVVNEQDAFAPGDLAYFASYYRDQLAGQPSEHAILRPDGSAWRTWTSALEEAPHYAASWWYWSWYLPSDPLEGYWTYRVQYEGQTVTHRFYVGAGTGAPGAPAAAGVALGAPRPNPFNPRTTLSLALARAADATLEVFDQRGRLVATLVDGPLAAGTHPVVWDGRDGAGRPAGSGVYLVLLSAEGVTRWQRATLLK